jgi:hypothetical protein
LKFAGWQVSADPSVPVYRVGDRVWGRYRNGRWYPARVAEVPGEGLYLLDWDDGDQQDRVKGPEEVPSGPNPPHTINRFLFLTLSEPSSSMLSANLRHFETRCGIQGLPSLYALQAMALCSPLLPVISSAHLPHWQATTPILLPVSVWSDGCPSS